jgi:drug/metabolite transporter (DMT)-like permease
VDLRLVGIVAALLSALAWAVGAILYKRLGEQSSATELNLLKSMMSLVLLLAVVVLEGAGEIEARDFLLLGLSGLIGISLGDTFFFAALQNLGAHTLIILSMLGQVLTVGLAVLLLAERPSALALTGVALVILGVAAVLHARFGQTPGQNGRRGITFGLLSILCMSTAVIVAKMGMTTVSPAQATFVRILWGTGGLIIWGGCTGRLGAWFGRFKDVKLVREIALAVLVATFGGFYLFHVALKHVDVTVVNTLNSVEPLFVMPLAAVFLNEQITRRGVTGALLAVSGIICLVNG